MAIRRAALRAAVSQNVIRRRSGERLAGSLNIARSAHAAGDDVIKIALVGCGGRGTGAAQQAPSTSGPIKLWRWPMCSPIGSLRATSN